MSLTLIITGMHRSGTSLLASFLQNAGINLGQNLLAGGIFNRRGYFEDVDFLEFQRRALQNCCHPDEPGWSDWGWTESEFLDRSKLLTLQSDAQNLITNRDRNAPVWGWKDPRTSLLLDFWHNLLPTAQYLLVYRFPWDVLDSVLRTNDPIFVTHPDYPLKIWAFYNRHLLKFYHKHPQQCILFNINSFIANPLTLVELLKNKLGLQVNPNLEQNNWEKIYDQGLFNQLEWNHPLILLLQRLAPQYLSLLTELDQAADLPSKFLCPAGTGEELGENLLLTLYRESCISKLRSHHLEEEKEKIQTEQNLKIAELQTKIETMQKSKFWQLQANISKLLGVRN